MRVYSSAWIPAMARFLLGGRKGGWQGNWSFSFLMRSPVSKPPSGFLLSSSSACQSRRFATGSGEASTSFGETKSTKQNKPCHFMLIQRLIPTAVWWGSQEPNCTQTQTHRIARKRLMQPPITQSFQNVLSVDEYLVLERVQTYAALIRQLYLSFK